MGYEVFNFIIGHSRDVTWRITQLEMAIVYLEGICGEPPPGLKLEIITQDREGGGVGDEVGTYYVLALTWDPPCELDKRGWEYFDRCEDVLLLLDEAMPWDEICFDAIREKLGWKESESSDMSPTPDQRPNWDRLRKHLDPEAKQALGKSGPELAWLELQDQVALAIEDEYYEEAKPLLDQLRLELGWEDSDGTLLVVLSGFSPVLGVNLFHESNPDFNLQDLSKRNRPLEVLQAIVKMLLTNEYFAY